MRIQWNQYRIPKGINPLIRAAAAYFCPECGSEIYSEWGFSPFDYMDLGETNKAEHELYYKKKAEARTFIFLDKCPCCDGLLLKTEGYFHQGYFGITEPSVAFFDAFSLQSQQLVAKELNHMFFYMNELRAQRETQELKRSAESRLDTIIKRHNEDKSFSIDLNRTQEIKASNELLTKYFSELTSLESRIYEISRRLILLYQQQKNIERLLKGEKAAFLYARLNLVNDCEQKLQTYRDMLANKINEAIQIKEIDRPKCPEVPVYKTAFFFNKKEIEKENKRIKEKYIFDLDTYHKTIDSIKEKEMQLYQEKEKKRENQILLLKQKIEQVESEINEHIKAFEKAKNEININYESPTKTFQEAVNREIMEAECTLGRAIKTRNALYSLDILFHKYRNFAAVSTICEYFVTGRCVTLDGTNGAYNMFENEYRTNTIISHIEKISNQLEDIKETQYVLYCELCKINKNLNYIGDIMDEALSEINNNVGSVLEGTKIIAYNSGINAYYSEMLPDILGNLQFYGISFYS